MEDYEPIPATEARGIASKACTISMFSIMCHIKSRALDQYAMLPLGGCMPRMLQQWQKDELIKHGYTVDSEGIHWGHEQEESSVRPKEIATDEHKHPGRRPNATDHLGRGVQQLLE